MILFGCLVVPVIHSHKVSLPLFHTLENMIVCNSSDNSLILLSNSDRYAKLICISSRYHHTWSMYTWFIHVIKLRNVLVLVHSPALLDSLMLLGYSHGQLDINSPCLFVKISSTNFCKCFSTLECHSLKVSIAACHNWWGRDSSMSTWLDFPWVLISSIIVSQKSRKLNTSKVSCISRSSSVCVYSLIILTSEVHDLQMY